METPLRFKTLETRFLVLLLIPVCLLMITGGTASFLYTRNLMLAQWNEGAVLKLERAAHMLEMRLVAPVRMLDGFLQAGAGTHPDEILAFLRTQEGVADVVYSGNGVNRLHTQGRMKRGMHFRRTGISHVSKPAYNAAFGGETLTITLELRNRDQSPAGSLSIGMAFDYLLKDFQQLGWWQSDMACIVDNEGWYLAHTNMTMDNRFRLGGQGDGFENKILQQMKNREYGTVKSQGHPPETIAGFYRLTQAPWTIIMFARGPSILAPIISYRNAFGIGILALSLMILILIRYQTGRVTRALQRLSDSTAKVEQGEYGPLPPIRGRDEISRLVTRFNGMVEGLQERDFIRNSFGRYVDPDFARQLMARPEAAALGGDRRDVVILMSDIREFTQFSEQLSPEDTIRILNLYFSRMIETIQSHGGIIVDFFGDAILVFFDSLDHLPEENTARAFRCGCRMQEQMGGFNNEVAGQGLPGFEMGIGIHAGPVVVGNIGSDTRAKYGIVGSAVNLTARIQARAGKGEIIVSEPVRERLGTEAEVAGTCTVSLKGIEHPVRLYTLNHGDALGDFQ